MVKLHKRCSQCTGNKFKNPVSCIDRCSYDIPKNYIKYLNWYFKQTDLYPEDLEYDLSLIYNNEFNFKEVNKYDR